MQVTATSRPEPFEQRPSGARSRGAPTPGARLALGFATVALVAVAANYSLRTLFEGLRYDTPLADLGFVPFICAGLAIWCRRGEANELVIRDRSLDLLIGVPSLIVASIVLLALPGPTSSLFWALRLDLLALPLLAIGAVTLVWGTQMAWRQRRALLFLTAAWPIPYTNVLVGVFAWLKATTTSVVVTTLKAVPAAGHVNQLPGSVIEVGHGTSAFTVAVATACSGAEGVLGFLLVAGAGSLVLNGRRAAKLVWLGAGAAAAFVSNATRIWLVLVVAAHFGQGTALHLLHPWVGTAAIGAVAVIAAAAAPRFGLSLKPRPPRPVRAAAPHPGWVVALVPLVVVLAITDYHLSVFRPVVGDLGQARLASLAADPPVVPGWRLNSSEPVTWATRFFGGGSAWTRQIYLVTAPGLQPTIVTADAVSTGDPGRFAAYGVADCFAFHGDHILHHGHVPLGHGVTADEFAYREHGAPRSWVSLSWVWPVVAARVRFERISLVAALDHPSPAGITAIEGSLNAFARAVTAERIARADASPRVTGGGAT